MRHRASHGNTVRNGHAASCLRVCTRSPYCVMLPLHSPPLPFPPLACRAAPKPPGLWRLPCARASAACVAAASAGLTGEPGLQGQPVC